MSNEVLCLGKCGYGTAFLLFLLVPWSQKCTAMAKAQPKLSPKKPSMRAQECTAYPTPMITGSGVLQR